MGAPTTASEIIRTRERLSDAATGDVVSRVVEAMGERTSRALVADERFWRTALRRIEEELAAFPASSQANDRDRYWTRHGAAKRKFSVYTAAPDDEIIASIREQWGLLNDNEVVTLVLRYFCGVMRRL